jgi:hypothetical protein
VIANFVGGSGQYDITDTYYFNCQDALAGAYNFVEGNTKDYSFVPNGTVYFGLRDANNPSNSTCITVFVDCDLGPVQ